MAKEYSHNGNKNNKGKKFSKRKVFNPDKKFVHNPSQEEGSAAEKPKFRKKLGQKPVFERFRDDSRPSDFGAGKDRKTGSEKGKTGKLPFERRKDKENKPFIAKYKKKPVDKKTFPEKLQNPNDLDESDFEYGNNTKSVKSRENYRSTRRKEKEPDGLIRLNKYIANAGICSRREADELIATGVVQVNGKTITEMGYKVKPSDVIKYGGQTLKKERLVYLILNKPKDYITTVDDPQERKTVLELIHGACRERVYPVGRLDRATTGLLMFTNDGELTKKLTHPRYGVRKIYHVTLDKPLKHVDLDKIAAGIELEDGSVKVDEISYVGDGADKTQVGIELHSGKNRIVRRIFENVGYNVRKLDRAMFGPLTKKDLPRGRWRFLTEAEIGMLKMLSAG